jgi:hypothetical protein
MSGCIRLIRDLVFTWMLSRLGVARALGCGCLLLLAAAVCVFYLVNGTLQAVF